MPRVGARVHCNGHGGRVRKLDLVRELVSFEREDDGEIEVVDVRQLSWERRDDLPRGRSRKRRGPRQRSGGGGRRS
jgi:hypothetical protein